MATKAIGVAANTKKYENIPTMKTMWNKQEENKTLKIKERFIFNSDDSDMGIKNLGDMQKLWINYLLLNLQINPVQIIELIMRIILLVAF